MTKSEFTDYIISFLAEHGYTVELKEINKLNTLYTGVVIGLPDKNIKTSLNLDKLYSAFEENPDVFVISDFIDQIRDSLSEPSFDLNNILDYEYSKDRLFIRVSNLQRLSDNIDVPTVQYLDLVFTAHIMIDTKNTERFASAIVDNNILNSFGISKEELFEQAFSNSNFILPIKRELYSASPMIIITNSRYNNGASAIFYPEIANQLFEELEDSYYILPSSIHETIVLKQSDCLIPIDELRLMVKDVNNTIVRSEDWLSDNVYMFDKNLRQIVIAE